jgi:hypothetical protein
MNLLRALAAAALLAGCYNPKINDTDFKCGPNNICPMGFSCVNGLCFQAAHAAQVDLSVGAFTGNCGLGNVDLTGMSGALFFDTESGAVTLTQLGDAGTANMMVVTAGASGFQKVHQGMPGAPVGPDVAVWSFQSLTIPSSVAVQPTTSSKSVLGLAACKDMTIQGNINWKGYGGFGGLPGLAGSDRNSGVPMAAGGGGGMDGSGGGGGGHRVKGGNGMGPTGGAGGASYGTPELTPIQVGSGGGGGGSMGTTGAGGGTGGGAVALFANKLTVSGIIDVSGSDGAKIDPTVTMASGGGGGGSAGSILLSGNQVIMDSGHSLVAAGGVGSAGISGGMPGGTGSEGRIWIGAYMFSTTGPLVSNPTATQAQAPVTTFPR